MTDTDDFLMHFGIKGMRWGVRKDSQPRLTRRERLEKAYATKYSVAVAKTKADSRIKTEKTLAIAGGVLVAAAVATVVGTKLHKEFAPINLKAGTKLQNINAFGKDLNLDKPTFATYKKRDNSTYAKKFVSELMGRPESRGRSAYRTVLESSKPIKAPSRSVQRKLFDAWKKERGLPKGFTLEGMNRGMMATGVTKPKSGDFLDYLSKRGFNAIQDTLDQGSSHYRARRPLMVFDGSDTLTSLGSYLVDQILNS